MTIDNTVTLADDSAQTGEKVRTIRQVVTNMVGERVNTEAQVFVPVAPEGHSLDVPMSEATGQALLTELRYIRAAICNRLGFPDLLEP